MAFSLIRLGVPPCWRTYFLLLRQKKVAKEKATPGYAVGYANSPALLEIGGGCGTRATPSDSPRPFSAAFSVARRSTRGPKTGTRPTIPRKINLHGQPWRKPKNENSTSTTDALPGPLRGAEQRRKAGGSRRGLVEGQSPEFRSRPAFRVAQGTGAAGTDLGSPSFCLLFLGEARKSKPPRKGGTPSQSSAKA